MMLGSRGGRGLCGVGRVRCCVVLCCAVLLCCAVALCCAGLCCACALCCAVLGCAGCAVLWGVRRATI